MLVYNRRTKIGLKGAGSVFVGYVSVPNNYVNER